MLNFDLALFQHLLLKFLFPALDRKTSCGSEGLQEYSHSPCDCDSHRHQCHDLAAVHDPNAESKWPQPFREILDKCPRTLASREQHASLSQADQLPRSLASVHPP